MTIQETEERKAKELFQQLKQDDECYAPGFARLLGTAAPNAERNAGRRSSLRLAMVPIALMLVLVTGGWFLFARQEQILLPPSLPEDTNQPGKLACNCGGELPAPKDDKPPKAVRHKRSALPMQMNALVSQWRSPTDFLLKPPGQRWLNEVPRLGVPLVEIKPLVIEQKNEMEEL